MRNFFQGLADDPAAGRFDAIVLDTPPADIYPDAALLAQWVDATVLVVDAVRSGEDAVRRVKDLLQRAGANLPGIVLNRASGHVRQAHADRDDVDDHALAVDQVPAPDCEPQTSQVPSQVRAEDNAGRTFPLSDE